MKKIKKIAASLMAVTAMLTSVTGIFANAANEDESNASVSSAESVSAGDGIAVWKETYKNGELVSIEGMAESSLLTPNYSKSVGSLTTIYMHTTTSSSDNRLILENIFNDTGSSRYASGNTYICDSNFNIDWSRYNGGSGSINYAPLTISVTYTRSELGSDVFYATYGSTLYAGNTSHAPVQNEALLYVPV